MSTKTKRNIRTLILDFLEYLKTKNYSDCTLNTYKIQLKVFVRFLNNKQITDLKLIDKNVIMKYQQYIYYSKPKDRKGQEHLSIQTQVSRLNAVKSFFNFLERRELILKNPTRFIEMPKMEQRIPRDILNSEEIEKLFSSIDTKTILGYRDRTILETFYSTGIRRSELLNLKLNDIDFEEKILFVRHGKNAKDRVVPLGSIALTYLKKYIEYIRPKLIIYSSLNNFLFLSRKGERISNADIGLLVKKHIKKSGITKNITCHSFRSSMATTMLKNGADIVYIQKILGHSRPESTQIYTQIDISDIKIIYHKTHPRD